MPTEDQSPPQITETPANFSIPYWTPMSNEPSLFELPCILDLSEIKVPETLSSDRKAKEPFLQPQRYDFGSTQGFPNTYRNEPFSNYG